MLPDWNATSPLQHHTITTPFSLHPAVMVILPDCKTLHCCKLPLTHATSRQSLGRGAALLHSTIHQPKSAPGKAASVVNIFRLCHHVTVYSESRLFASHHHPFYMCSFSEFCLPSITTGPCLHPIVIRADLPTFGSAVTWAIDPSLVSDIKHCLLELLS